MIGWRKSKALVISAQTHFWSMLDSKLTQVGGGYTSDIDKHMSKWCYALSKAFRPLLGSEESGWMIFLSPRECLVAYQLKCSLVYCLLLSKLFERMGTTYIKLDQFIASAPTFFPPEYVKEFQNSFNKAHPVSFEEIHTFLQEELGCPIDSVTLTLHNCFSLNSTRPGPWTMAQGLEANKRMSWLRSWSLEIEDFLVTDLNYLRCFLYIWVLEFWVQPYFTALYAQKWLESSF